MQLIPVRLKISITACCYTQFDANKKLADAIRAIADLVEEGTTVAASGSIDYADYGSWEIDTPFEEITSANEQLVLREETTASEALAKIKDDSAPSELADTKRRLESCLSLLGHACGTSPSPTWPYVLEFARRMEKKLDANRHKGNREGWINDDPASLIRRIQGETDELIGAIHKGQNAQRIADEAADTANFCMMAADWFLAREEPPKNLP